MELSHELSEFLRHYEQCFEFLSCLCIQIESYLLLLIYSQVKEIQTMLKTLLLVVVRIGVDASLSVELDPKGVDDVTLFGVAKARHVMCTLTTRHLSPYLLLAKYFPKS